MDMESCHSARQFQSCRAGSAPPAMSFSRRARARTRACGPHAVRQREGLAKNPYPGGRLLKLTAKRIGGPSASPLPALSHSMQSVALQPCSDPTVTPSLERVSSSGRYYPGFRSALHAPPELLFPRLMRRAGTPTLAYGKKKWRVRRRRQRLQPAHLPMAGACRDSSLLPRRRWGPGATSAHVRPAHILSRLRPDAA